MQDFYRTAHGKARHASFGCANRRRKITSGDPTVIPAAEVADWAPCRHCCSADLIEREGAPVAARTATARPAGCRNSGVTHPKRINSACRDCGKVGKVNRSTGTIRAHAPQA